MADNFTFKDAGGITRIFRAKEISAGIWTPYHILLDSTGAEVLGEKGKASGIPTNFATDQHLLGRGVGNVSASFTRPPDVTPYSIGDLAANSTVAGSVVPLAFSGAARFAGGGGLIARCRLFKTSTNLTNAQFTIHLFKTSPVPTVGDNSAFNTAGALSTNNGVNYIGPFPVTMNTSFTDGAHGSAIPAADADNMHFKLTAGTSLFALLEVRAAYVPASAEVFTAILEGPQT